MVVQFFKGFCKDFAEVVTCSEKRRVLDPKNHRMMISLAFRILGIASLALGCVLLARAFFVENLGKKAVYVCGSAFSLIVMHDSLRFGSRLRDFLLSDQICRSLSYHWKENRDYFLRDTLLFSKVDLLVRRFDALKN